ncbi:MAG: TIGR04283 family arsenosugar biosynthesis glycosyltransferase [Burkholderiaceae bacterium]
MHLSIIIPALNEAAALPATLAALAPLAERGAQILVVDGGSTDATFALALQSGTAGVQALRSQPGRARQMNTGAAQSSGDVLLFLHADTRLPPAADDCIASALAAGAASPAIPPAPPLWGRFDVHIEGRSRWLPLVARLINLRSRLSGIATGDQALFVTAAAFRQVGGFPDQPLMEDVELCKRLGALSRPACLREKVTTSGRRWDQRGALRTIVLMWRLRWLYWRGVPADALARLYR